MKTHFATAALITFLVLPVSGADWREKVTTAKALEDPVQRRDALLVLLREALPGREVQLSGEKHQDNVHPEDNQPAPVINFDIRLNQKQSAKPRSGGSTRALKNNFGYYFTLNLVPYVVIGPEALDPRSPMLTRLAVEHEMFHAENHPGDRRPLNDRELETWSEMFVRFFGDIHQFRQRWRPMIDYYESASAEERVAAVDRLVKYYRRSDSVIRAAYDQWLGRRAVELPSSKLVADLQKALKSETPPPAD